MEVLSLKLKIINYKLRLAIHRKEADKMNEIKEYTTKLFEDIKHIDEQDNEYWLARELQIVLRYNQWRSINDLIERAKVACKESNNNIDDHFALQRKMIKLAKGATRKVIDMVILKRKCLIYLREVKFIGLI